MAWAALRPAAIASMAVAAPVTTSPPEKTPSTVVSKVLSLTCTVCQRVRFSVSPKGSMLAVRPPKICCACVLWPMAAMIQSASTTNSEPRTGLGLRRPLASGSPSSMRRHSRPAARPSLTTTRVGATRKSILTPSWSASSISISLAGISLRVRR